MSKPALDPTGTEMATGARETLPFVALIEPNSAFYRYLSVVRRNGFRTLVLSSNPDETRGGEQLNPMRSDGEGSCIDELVTYRALTVEGLLDAVGPHRDQIAGVVAGDFATVPIAAEFGRALGFHYALPEDAQCQHVKTAMKRRLVERGVRTPPFVVATTLDQAVDAWEHFGRDCMLKMVDFAASLNIFRVVTREQLVDAWDKIVSNRLGVKGFLELSRDVILEEFVAGRELTAEGYIQGDQITILNFSEKLTESNFIVVGHYIPALVTDAEARTLSECAAQCVRALGVRNSVFHVEMHVRDGLPYVIECASRPPGQHTVELIDKAYGIDLMEISVDLATGKAVDVSRREPRQHYAILALYTKATGILRGFEGLEALRARGGVLHVALGTKPGDRVDALETFHNKYGFVVLESASPHDVREKAAWLRQHVRMDVAPAESGA